MKKFVVALAASAMALFGLSACGGSNPTYVPSAAAWGNAGLGQCYMPLGVPQSAWQAIQQQYITNHYCQPGWTPVYMPQSTYMAYYPYWSSGVFYNHYLPVTYRTSYVSYETGFGRQYHSQILTAERTATYKGSNGKTTTYNKIKSGGGSRSSFGTGGTRCSAVRDVLLQPQYQTKGGGGGFSGGGSRGGGGYSGGGSRSGSSGSRSGSGSSKSGSGSSGKTGSGSKSGC